MTFSRFFSYVAPAGVLAAVLVFSCGCGQSETTDPAAGGSSGQGVGAGSGGGAEGGTGGSGAAAGQGGQAGAAGKGGSSQAGQGGSSGQGNAGSAGSAGEGGSAGTQGGAGGQGGASGQDFQLRIMAANLTSGNQQSYDPGHGIRIMQAMKPDIILIQEFKYQSNDDPSFRALTDEVCGTECEYFHEPHGSLPNGVISRYPIVKSGSWDDSEVSNRGFAWATIDLPGPRDLLAVSVHFLTKSSGERSKEGKQVVQYLDSMKNGGVLPYYVVIGGDFNSESRTENWVNELKAHFVTTGPYPVDNEGNGNTNAHRNKPYDWVLANPALDSSKTPLVIGNSTFDNGLVFDSRVYTPLSEVSPVQPGDSAASNMQHMGVVRQFRIMY